MRKKIIATKNNFIVNGEGKKSFISVRIGAPYSSSDPNTKETPPAKTCRAPAHGPSTSTTTKGCSQQQSFSQLTAENGSSFLQQTPECVLLSLYKDRAVPAVGSEWHPVVEPFWIQPARLQWAQSDRQPLTCVRNKPAPLERLSRVSYRADPQQRCSRRGW